MIIGEHLQIRDHAGLLQGRGWRGSGAPRRPECLTLPAYQIGNKQERPRGTPGVNHDRPLPPQIIRCGLIISYTWSETLFYANIYR